MRLNVSKMALSSILLCFMCVSVGCSSPDARKHQSVYNQHAEEHKAQHFKSSTADPDNTATHYKGLWYKIKFPSDESGALEDAWTLWLKDGFPTAGTKDPITNCNPWRAEADLNKVSGSYCRAVTRALRHKDLFQKAMSAKQKQSPYVIWDGWGREGEGFRDTFVFAPFSRAIILDAYQEGVRTQSNEPLIRAAGQVVRMGLDLQHGSAMIPALVGAKSIELGLNALRHLLERGNVSETEARLIVEVLQQVKNEESQWLSIVQAEYLTFYGQLLEDPQGVLNKPAIAGKNTIPPTMGDGGMMDRWRSGKIFKEELKQMELLLKELKDAISPEERQDIYANHRNRESNVLSLDYQRFAWSYEQMYPRACLMIMAASYRHAEARGVSPKTLEDLDKSLTEGCSVDSQSKKPHVLHRDGELLHLRSPFFDNKLREEWGGYEERQHFFRVILSGAKKKARPSGG